MKKVITKIMHYIMLVCVIFSSLQTPLMVFADTTTPSVDTPKKGDIKLGLDGEISQDGSVSMVGGATTITNDGDVQIIKTVSKVNDDGKYKVEFTVKGQDVDTVIQTTKPIYLVIVFDTSGSMICNSSNGSYAYDRQSSAGRYSGSYTAADGKTIYCSNASGSNSSNILSSKWEGAVNGAVSFSDDLTKIANTNVSVVTFASSASEASAWSQSKLPASAFGHPVGGTNLKAGIETAKAKLDTVTDKNAQKYILVIGDGKPTEGGSGYVSATQAAKRAAYISKNAGINIFAIGYGIGTGSSSDSDDFKEAQDVLKDISSNTTINSSNPTGNENGTYEDKGYYHLASTSSLSASLKTVFESIGEAAKAGTDATITDTVGGKFSIVTNDSSSVTYGGTKSFEIAEITEEGVKVSFEIQIDRNANTGWYNTNAGFTLTYTDSKNNSQTITYGDDNDEVDPYVYWESYKYTVNYYKDSLEGELLGTYTYTTDKDSVIDVNDIDTNKHLSDAGNGYEFNSVSPESIIANDNMNPVVINVIYTLKEYTYDVEYYYDNVLDSIKSDIGPVTHGEKVDPKNYYLENIRDGYKLDTDKSDSEIITIDSNDKVIRIYYIKDNFDYTVNYHFGEYETIDNDLTIKDSALFGSTINPSDKYLSNDKLISEGYEDYFLNPNKPYLPSEGLIIGSDSSKNIIDIYYINTDIVSEDITKKADKTIISSSSDLIQYTVNYKASIENVKENSQVVITIIDTLPKKIDLSKSNLNGGVYNEASDTITWTITKTVEEFTSLYEVNETITYTVNYKDFANMSSSLNNMLLNTVKGMTTINTDTSNGTEDNEEVEVAIDGTLIVKHVDEEGNELLDTVTTTKKVGTSYSESKKDITGYSIKVEPTNKEGKYIEGTITVEFIYEKNEYGYTVNYHFNNVLDESLTVNNNALYESVIKASDNYLSNSTLSENGYEDFFLNPVMPQDKDEIIIDVEEDKNVINIYYVNNEVKEEEIEKTTSSEIVDSKSDKVSYSVNYKTEITNVKENSQVVITIVDTLPYEIDLDSSNLNGGIYDKDSKTITWTITKTVEEFTELYKIDETVEYEVLYLDFADISSSENNTLVNKVSGNTTVGSFETNGSEDEVEVPVEVYGDVVATYKNTDGVELHENVSSTGLSGSLYETETKSFYGYTLKSVPSNKNGKYVGEQTIYVDYIYEKNEYKYTVNYHFNKVLDESLTVNNNALYESVIKAEDNYLSNSTLSENGYEDFFLNPVMPQDKDEIIIDVEEDKNVINIYYVNNEVKEEEIEKTTSSEIVDSKSDKVSYSVNYKTEITNVKENSQVVITIVDTLPYEIDLDSSNLNGGIYDKDSKTITWTITKTVEEFTELYKIDETVEYEVLYLDFADISSSENNTLVNKVSGNTTVGSFETNGSEDEVEVPVEVYGDVVATYKNTDGVELHENVSSTGLSGSLYETETKSFYGYTLKSVPSNKNGKYVGEQTIYVDYVYEKNIGTSEEELIKTGDEIVSSIDAPFKYTITYVTEIFDYIGDVEIEIIDTPEAEIDEEKSIISDNCRFENGTIVCNYIKTINSEEDSIINISEDFTLYYIGISNQKVLNKVNSKLVYGEEFKTNDSEFESIVASGRVISNYVTVDGTILDEAIIQENLVGSEYTTYEKSFEKYFLKEVIGEENGKFTIEDINVTYVYDLIPMPPQTGYENNYFSIIGLITFILSLFIIRKKC